MRIALLSYRSKPHCGGQGVYVRHLSRELVALGHTVEVFSGPPYPELDPGVVLTEVPSLDLYREPDPFRVPRLREFRDRVDVEEFLTMCTAGFPEPKTFSTRVAKVLRARAGDFDVVHDNQVLGHGMVDIASFLPMVTTIHHPITHDRRIDLAQATTWKQRLTLRRWYGFLRMQGKVARQMRFILTPSESSRRDAARDFGIDPQRMRVVQLGVEERFRPPAEPRVPGRIMAMASADAPVKGIATLLESFAKLRVERPHLELVLVSKPVAGGRTERLIDQLGLEGSVRFVHGLSDDELVTLMGSAELACVPSLYEGFSLPTAELMACATPLVVSRAGAIPEVVGPDGECADLVEPGDVGQLTHAIEALLDDPERRRTMGAAGRRRVEERFSWRAVAQATADTYQEAIRAHR